MRTNGCTMTYGKGGLGTCERHLGMVREETEPHARRGPQVRVHSYSGPMRKHGGDHAQEQDRTLRELDVVAGAQLSGHVFAVRIRRRGAIVGGVTRVR